jgi:hypothetical protein
MMRPSCSMAMRSAMRMAAAMSEVIEIAVAPSSCTLRSTRLQITWVVIGSRPAVGSGGNGAGKADALLHAAGQFRRQQVGGFRRQADGLQGLHRDRAGLLDGGVPLFQQLERDVAPHRQRVEQCGLLEQHAEAAAHGFAFVAAQADGLLAVEQDAAAVGPHQAHDDFQQQGLAATGFAEQHQRLAGIDVQVDAGQHCVLAERLGQAGDGDLRLRGGWGG